MDGHNLTPGSTRHRQMARARGQGTAPGLGRKRVGNGRAPFTVRCQHVRVALGPAFPACALLGRADLQEKLEGAFEVAPGGDCPARAGQDCVAPAKHHAARLRCLQGLARDLDPDEERAARCQAGRCRPKPGPCLDNRVRIGSHPKQHHHDIESMARPEEPRRPGGSALQESGPSVRSPRHSEHFRRRIDPRVWPERSQRISMPASAAPDVQDPELAMVESMPDIRADRRAGLESGLDRAHIVRGVPPGSLIEVVVPVGPSTEERHGAIVVRSGPVTPRCGELQPGPPSTRMA